jgi:hypothetical protein
VARLMTRARARVGGTLAVLVCIAGALPASADALWFESGDTALRMDLQLLNDASVIRLPINQWPIPRASVRYALEHGKEHFAVNGAVIAALARVRARLDGLESARRPGASFDVAVTAGRAGLLRNFDTAGRDDGELSGGAAYSLGERAEVSLQLAAVANPDDDQGLRADGSHVSAQFGNWLLSANTLDRWWGPGHEGSLILSNNARPMPTLMVERAAAIPFQTGLLSWLGPWRMSFGLSRMENERVDVDAPLFLAWRVSVMPFRDIEFGFSRTAQFCGRGRPCSLVTFKNMLIGNDNIGFDATPENEPGNQMAGFDIRWNSPIGNWPYAIYSQMIGEDEANYLPVKYLEQFGIESWKSTAGGGLLQAFAEYSSTTCSANTSRGPYYNCAYNQGIFNTEGYRYHGRVIGYTTDRDAETYSIGTRFRATNGQLWSATARTSRLNHDDFGDFRNTVASAPTNYDALELGWSGRVHGHDIEVDFGVESIDPKAGANEVRPFGFVRWKRAFSN